MKTPTSLLPDLPTLDRRLKSALNGDGRRVRIVERQRPRYMSTFPNEIVTCQLADGSRRRLFCKYEAGRSHNSHGHRGGLAYEAEVYRRVLGPLPTLRPRFVGVHSNGADGGTWLMLEYLDRCTRLKDIRVRLKGISQPVALALAAGWLGQFHAAQQILLVRGDYPFLRRYDARYYAGWMERTCQFAKPMLRDIPWLARLHKSGGGTFGPLLQTPATVIHGEFYINNILVRGKQVFPVDWESAAIGAGEIDLAALIEGPWRETVVRRCQREYQRARWPEGAPAEFTRTLDAARLYLHFRWLGERPDWTLRESNRWRFGQLRSLATRLGLI